MNFAISKIPLALFRCEIALSKSYGTSRAFIFGFVNTDLINRRSIPGSALMKKLQVPPFFCNSFNFTQGHVGLINMGKYTTNNYAIK